MSTLKRTLLHSLLCAAFLAFPVAGFSNGTGDMNGHNNGDKDHKPPTEMKEEPHTEKVAARFRFGVYYGRPYYYRPYYYYYPYRPYYYRYNYYPYRPYGFYRW